MPVLIERPEDEPGRIRASYDGLMVGVKVTGDDERAELRVKALLLDLLVQRMETTKENADAR